MSPFQRNEAGYPPDLGKGGHLDEFWEPRMLSNGPK